MRERHHGRSRLSRMGSALATRLTDDRTTGVTAPVARRPVRVGCVRPGRWLLASMLLVPLASGQGEIVRTNVQVTATVLPHAHVEELAALPVLVEPSAVARGYVDVTRRYRLSTNAPERALLQMHPRLGLTEAIDVRVFGATLRLVDASLEVLPAGRGPFEITYRLWLAPGVAPGTYPLPVQVSASVR
jgi:hypothetical protein